MYLVAKISTGTAVCRFGGFSWLVLFAYLAQMVSLIVSVHANGQHFLNAFRESHKFFIHAPLALIIMDWYGRPPWFERMLKAVVVTLFVLSVYGIIQFHTGAAWSVGEVASGYNIQGRAFATIRGGANSYSGFLELTVPTTLAASFFFRNKKWKALGFLSAGLGVLNGLYTYSRGGFITITLACLAYLIFRFRKRVWVPILAISIFSAFIFSNAEMFNRQLVLLTDPSSTVIEATLIHRYVTYSRYIMDISAHPLTGVGWGAREYFSSGSSLYSFWEARHERSTDHIEHFGGLNSLIFDMVLKGGIASAISLMLIAGAAAFASVKAFRTRGASDLCVGMISGLTAFAAHQLVDNLLQWPQTGAFFWIVMGLLAVIGRKQPGNPYITAEDRVSEEWADPSPESLRE